MKSKVESREDGRRIRRPRRVPWPLLCILAVACAASGGSGGERSDGGRAAAADPEQSREGPAGRDPVPPLDRAWVIFGADTVVAEVARTPEQRQRGLMYREELPDGTGMLFVFEEPSVHSFWMANTYVALDIAYMDASYRIVDIVAMDPLVTDPYPSDAPAMFALEVRQGWFAEQGIAEGDTATIEFGRQVGG